MLSSANRSTALDVCVSVWFVSNDAENMEIFWPIADKHHEALWENKQSCLQEKCSFTRCVHSSSCKQERVKTIWNIDPTMSRRCRLFEIKLSDRVYMCHFCVYVFFGYHTKMQCCDLPSNSSGHRKNPVNSKRTGKKWYWRVFPRLPLILKKRNVSRV